MTNPPDPRPVYEYDQVITETDIVGIRTGYIYQYKMTKWYNFKRRWMLLVAIGICDSMLAWVKYGKPQTHI